jgi:hypothetical protein
MFDDIKSLNFSVVIEEHGSEFFRLAESNNENLAEWSQDVSVRLVPRQ